MCVWPSRLCMYIYTHLVMYMYRYNFRNQMTK